MSLAGLVDVIHWLEDVFDRLQLKRSYDGAIAYNYYGPPRLTQDVDVLALIPDLKAPALVEEFATAVSICADPADNRRRNLRRGYTPAFAERIPPPSLPSRVARRSGIQESRRLL